AKKSLSTKQANQLLSASEGKSLELLLVERGMLDKHSLLGIKSTLCDLTPVDLQLVNIDLNVVRLLPGSMSRKFSAVVYALDEDKLMVALANPTDPFARYFIGMRTNREIECRVAYLGDVQSLQDQAYPAEELEGASGPALLQAPAQTPRVGMTEEAAPSSGGSRRVDLPQGPHTVPSSGNATHLIGRPHQPVESGRPPLARGSTPHMPGADAPSPRPASPSLSPADRQKTLDKLDEEIAQRRARASGRLDPAKLDRDTLTPLPAPPAPAPAAPPAVPPAPAPFTPDVVPEMRRSRPEPPPASPKPTAPPAPARSAPPPEPAASVPPPSPKAAAPPAPTPAAPAAASSAFTVPVTARIETKAAETARLRDLPASLQGPSTDTPPPSKKRESGKLANASAAAVVEAAPRRPEPELEDPETEGVELIPIDDEIELVWEEEAPKGRPGPDLLETISNMAMSVAESGRLSYIEPLILKTARQLTGAETAAFLMVEQDRRYISYHSTVGARQDATQYAVPFDDTTLPGWCVINEKGLSVNSLKGEARFDTKAEETAGVPTGGTACVPVRWGAEVVGALLVASPRPVAFDVRPLFTLAAPLAAAVKARQMESRIHDIRMETVQALLDWSEAGSPGARQHSSEVAQVASAMAKNMALPPNEVDEIYMAALLHDIGLIPDKNATEHPQRAGQILQKVRILQKMLPLIRYHHERYDGTGYPHGLQGEAIPLGARVLAVAEAWCEEDLKRFSRRSAEVERFLVRFGTEFDPTLKAAFIRAVNLES
ncbi:MAG TPA: HD domain-containing phosphohydrolase, partial [Candidatus Xenobia bacterium]